MKVLKAALRFAWKTVRAVAFVGLSLIILSLLVDVPGCRRYRRYRAYPNLRGLTAAETNDIRKVFAFRQDGSNFTAVVVKPCRALASGPAVLVYDADGRLVDHTRDYGDYPLRRVWNFSWTDFLVER